MNILYSDNSLLKRGFHPTHATDVSDVTQRTQLTERTQRPLLSHCVLAVASTASAAFVAHFSCVRCVRCVRCVGFEPAVETLLCVYPERNAEHGIHALLFDSYANGLECFQCVHFFANITLYSLLLSAVL